jgi:hypothetical protein
MVSGLVVVLMWGVVWGLAVEPEMPRHPEPDLVQVRAAGTSRILLVVASFLVLRVECMPGMSGGRMWSGSAGSRMVGAELGQDGLGC